MSAEFQNAMRAAGLEPPEYIEPGKLHRFPGLGKSNGNTAGWCKLFDDGIGGVFGDFAADISESWQAKREKPFTVAEKEAFKRDVEEVKAQTETDQKAKHAEARERANLILAESVPSKSHCYLALKGIQPHGARLYKENLVLPIRDQQGVLQTLQFIHTDGKKKFLSGGKVRGGHFSIGKPDGVLCICEGFATGASIREATGYAVAVAFDCGNLKAAALALRQNYPDVKLIVCADDDSEAVGNPGLIKAKEAAQAVGGLLALPNFGNDRPLKVSDFNDMAAHLGLDAVRISIDEAIRLDGAQTNNQAAFSETRQSDDEIIRRLAKLKPRDYDKVRIAQAKTLGIRPATLDAEVKEIRAEASEASRLPFVEIDPHPDPVNPAQLLNEISDTIRRFLVLDTEQAHAATLWVALTWFVDVVEYVPLAIINAPEKACGKTQLLTVLRRMAYRPLPAANASASALFRAVELWRPTIFIDEADTFFRDNTELHGLVNAGYQRDGFVLRSEATGDNFEPRVFSVFSAKALAGIALEKHLPDATMSRGIIFNMRRKLSYEAVNRLRHAPGALFETIAAKLARFAADYSPQVKQARPVLPEALGDREQDNWDGLLAIASCAGNEWLDRATKAALKLSGAGEKTVSASNELLADIQHVWNKTHLERISTVDMLRHLCEDEESAWATYNRGKPLTPRQLARLLAGYGIASKTIRLGAYETQKGFEISQFSDAFARYLPQNALLSVTESQTNNHGPFSVTDSENATPAQIQKVTPKPAPNKACDLVTDKKPILGGTEEARSQTNHLRI